MNFGYLHLAGRAGQTTMRDNEITKLNNLNGHFSKQSNWWLFHILRNWVIILYCHGTVEARERDKIRFSYCDKSRRACTRCDCVYCICHAMNMCFFGRAGAGMPWACLCVSYNMNVCACGVEEKSQLIWETSKSRFQGLSTIFILLIFCTAGGIYLMCTTTQVNVVLQCMMFLNVAELNGWHCAMNRKKLILYMMN